MRAPAAIATALLGLGVAACGFAPERDFTGRRTGDGIAPWTDLGPVYACIGNEFVGPPDTAPGGLCFASDVTETLCLGDADCESRETCVCGRCTIQYCDSTSDCSGGRVCSFSEHRCDRPCAADEECTIDEACFNGTCRGRCLVEADCQTGEVCNSQNRCVTADCSEDDECLAGERCRVQRVPRVALEPTLLAGRGDGDPRLTIYLELSSEANPDDRAIYRAVSEDGQRFRIDPAAPVIEDGGAAHAPSAIRTDDGLVAIYYEAGDGESLRVVESVDGVAFGAPQTVLDPAGVVRAPSAVVLPGGDVAVYYQVGDGAAIALATGAPGGSLAAEGEVLVPGDLEDPTFSDDGQRWVDVEAVRSPHAAVTSGADGPALRLWFAAFGRESGDSFQFGEIVPIPANYSLGYAGGDPAEPSELTPWPFNPILDRVSAFLEHRSELTPAVVQITRDGAADDGYLLYYVDAETTDAAGPFALGRMGVAGNGVYR